MLVQKVNKHRQAASVVKTALVSAGFYGRSVCIQSDSWLDKCGHHVNYAVFVSAPIGSNIEPYYETGEKLVEVVRSVIDSIRGKNSAKSDVNIEIAPF